MLQKEGIRASAENALQWSQFELFCRLAPIEAAKWADIAITRAENANDFFSLYAAASLRGLIAAEHKDGRTVRQILEKLASLMDKNVSLGDAIIFFEAASELDEDIYKDVRRMSLLIAPQIQDVEFRRRALQLGSEKHNESI